jgi:colicin import membrane protein
MASSGLFAEIKNHPWIIALVVAVHIVLIVLLSINLLDDDKPPMPASEKHQTINAIAVDAKAYDEREKKKQQAEQKKIDDLKAAKEKQRDLERAKALAKQKALDEKKALEKKKALEDKKREQQLAAEKKAEQEKQRLAIAKQKEAKQKEAEQKLAKEKLAREKKAEELRIKQEELRKQQEKQAAEEKRRLEEQQRRADEKAQLERDMLEEERREEEARVQAARQARLQTQREQYIMQIAKKVEDNWMRPIMTSSGQSCDVVVRQTMSGDVIDVQLDSCTADNAFQRSVERAVRAASPLPLPPDPELFDNQIYFKFKPNP